MQELHVVMYHYIRELKDSRYPQIKGLEYSLFKQQIRFFKEKFNIVTMEDVIAAYDGIKRLPEKALLITFDDGYIDNFTYAFPVLMEERIQGSFFIPGVTITEHKLMDMNKVHFVLASTDGKILAKEIMDLMNYYRGKEFDIPSNEELFEKYAIADRFDSKEVIFCKRILQTALPERLRGIIASELFKKYIGIPESSFAREIYLSRDQISCMKRAGMHIGIHGYEHYWLNNVKKEIMQKDILKALDVMDEFIDKDNWVMNYPYGGYNQDVVDFSKSQGCTLGLTIDFRVADIDKDSRYLVPRLDTNDYPPKSENYKKSIIL